MTTENKNLLTNLKEALNQSEETTLELINQHMEKATEKWKHEEIQFQGTWKEATKEAGKLRKKLEDAHRQIEEELKEMGIQFRKGAEEKHIKIKRLQKQ